MEASIVFYVVVGFVSLLFAIGAVIQYKEFTKKDEFQNTVTAVMTEVKENTVEAYVSSIIPLFSIAKIEGLFVKNDFLQALSGVLNGELILTREYGMNLFLYSLKVNAAQEHSILVTFNETNNIVSNVQIYYKTGDTIKIPLIIAATSPSKIIAPVGSGFIKLMNGEQRPLKLVDLQFPNLVNMNQSAYGRRFIDAIAKGNTGFLLHGPSGIGKTQFIEFLLAFNYKSDIDFYELDTSYLDSKSFSNLEKMILSSSNNKVVLSFGQKFDNLISSGERTREVEDLLEFLNKPSWKAANKKLTWIAATNANPDTLIAPWQNRFPKGDRLEFRNLTALELEEYAKTEGEVLMSAIPSGEYSYYDLRSFV
jgi:hypothetical protein